MIKTYLVLLIPFVAKAHTCKKVCAKDNCKRTSWNPIPNGETWYRDPSGDSSGCCAFKLGKCHRCCDFVVYNGECANGTPPDVYSRTEDDECIACDDGYVLVGKRCVFVEECVSIQYTNFLMPDPNTNIVPDQARDITLATIEDACDLPYESSPLVRVSSSSDTVETTAVSVSKTFQHMVGVTVGASVAHKIEAGVGIIKTEGQVTLSVEAAYQHTWSDTYGETNTDSKSTALGFWLQATIHLPANSKAAIRTTLESYTYSTTFTANATCFNADGEPVASDIATGVFEGSFYVGNGLIAMESLQCPDRSCSDYLRPATDGETCGDSCHWFDAGGSDYDCTWYSQSESRCSQYGDNFQNFGMTANTACCTCGGGDQLTGWDLLAAIAAGNEVPASNEDRAVQTELHEEAYKGEELLVPLA